MLQRSRPFANSAAIHKAPFPMAFIIPRPYKEPSDLRIDRPFPYNISTPTDVYPIAFDDVALTPRISYKRAQEMLDMHEGYPSVRLRQWQLQYLQIGYFRVSSRQTRQPGGWWREVGHKRRQMG